MREPQHVAAMLTAAVPFTFAAVFRLRSIGHLALHPGSPP
jgi:hypothetical protein